MMFGRRVAVAVLACALGVTTAPAAASDRTFADVRINGAAAAESLVTIDGDDVLMPVDTLTKAGVHDFAGRRSGAGETELVSLRSLAPDITFTFDPKNFVVAIVAKTSNLTESSIDLAPPAPTFQVAAAKGSGYFNYALTRDSVLGTSFDGEFGVARGAGLLYGTFRKDPSYGLRREETRWMVDDTAHERRFEIGDGELDSSDDDPLSGMASIAGVSVRREARFNPNAVHRSGAGLAGTVSSPSTVEVYVNGALVMQQNIAPGPFQLKNIPLTQGQNDAKVVIRDAFGRTQVVEHAFYMGTNLLQRGHTDYAYAVGRIRDPFGAVTSYGPAAASARYALGLTDALTVGGRLETESGMTSLGAHIGVQTPVGTLSAAAGASRANGLPGAALDVNYGYFKRGFGLSAELRRESPSYATEAERIIDDRALEQVRFGVTRTFGAHDIALSALDVRYRDQPRRSELALTDTTRLGNVVVTFGRSLYRNGAATASGFILNLNYVLGDHARAAAGTQLQSGVPTRTVEVERDVPVSGGFGFRVHQQATASQGTLNQGTFSYRSRYGVVDAMVDGPSAVGLRMSGGIAFVGNSAVLTAPVTGSFGVIEAGVPGVRATVNNQYVGRTDAKGRLFVPNLFPYSANDITLAAEDAPLDRQLIDAHRTIVPRNGAGVAIAFESRTIRAFTGRLVVQMPGGARKIPAAGTISLSGGGRTYSSDIGEDGAYYFENLTPGVYDAQIVSALGRCAFRFDPGPSRGVLTRVGEQTCVVR